MYAVCYRESWTPCRILLGRSVLFCHGYISLESKDVRVAVIRYDDRRGFLDKVERGGDIVNAERATELDAGAIDPRVGDQNLFVRVAVELIDDGAEGLSEGLQRRPRRTWATVKAIAGARLMKLMASGRRRKAGTWWLESIPARRTG